MMVYYQNELYKSLNIYTFEDDRNISQFKKIKLDRYETLDITEKELEEFKNKYPEFIFKSGDHEFMSK